MNVLALDQATAHTGFSFWGDGKLIECGVLDEDRKIPILERMNSMTNQIEGLVKEHDVDAVCVEGVQYQSSQKTYGQLAQLQGFIFRTLFAMGISFVVVEPSSWKAYCGISGRARAEQKQNTIEWVKEKYGLAVSEDVADSIGIGYWAINNIVE